MKRKATKVYKKINEYKDVVYGQHVTVQVYEPQTSNDTQPMSLSLLQLIKSHIGNGCYMSTKARTEG